MQYATLITLYDSSLDFASERVKSWRTPPFDSMLGSGRDRKNVQPHDMAQGYTAEVVGKSVRTAWYELEQI